jgi:hypothetical protein
MKWTSNNQIELKELANSGLTARNISIKLTSRWQKPVTRNMVIGRMNRTDVEFTHTIKLQSRRVRKRIKLVKLGIPITELTFTTCRWPLWPEQTQEHLYCGATKVKGSPYCCEHNRLAIPHGNQHYPLHTQTFPQNQNLVGSDQPR